MSGAAAGDVVHRGGGAPGEMKVGALREWRVGGGEGGRAAGVARWRREIVARRWSGALMEVKVDVQPECELAEGFTAGVVAAARGGAAPAGKADPEGGLAAGGGSAAGGAAVVRETLMRSHCQRWPPPEGGRRPGGP